MTVAYIPTYSDPFYTLTSTLDGVTYLLTFDYNQRCDCWYLSVATEEGDDIYNGIKLVCDWPLLHKCADTRAPAGELMCWSNTTDKSPARLGDLVAGGRCQLIYIDASDMP
jgi:hypothetical protein